jgi:hypothetical protein
MMADWKRPLSWAALAVALVGFVLSLGIHLAAWGAINADLWVPGLVQVLRLGFYPSVFIAIIGNIYFVLNKSLRATYAVLPGRLRLMMQWGVVLFMGYWLVYSAATFTLSPGTGAAAATVNLRDESCRWLLVCWLLLQVVIEYSWGWKLFAPRQVSGSPAPR